MHLDVPGLVDRKVRQAVVNQMIVKYQAEVVDPGQHKLANGIGKRVSMLGDCTGDTEWEYRSADLYQTIFPDHVACEMRAMAMSSRSLVLPFFKGFYHSG